MGTKNILIFNIIIDMACFEYNTKKYNQKQLSVSKYFVTVLISIALKYSKQGI